MSVLVFNAGSSSLKFSLFSSDVVESQATGSIAWKSTAGEAECVVQRGMAEQRSTAQVRDHGSAVRHALRALGGLADIDGVGHRVVHGGARFSESVRIDRDVLHEIDRFSALAPLHNPPALQAIEAAEELLPHAAHVAVFDTAFFAALPPQAFLYPVPYEWCEAWGVRRFGFHGISHAYCAGRAAEMLNPIRPPRGDSSEGGAPRRIGGGRRLVICHLGNGCSATAVCDASPAATSMGFTPMEGLMMGTRSGSIDPGILLYLLRSQRLSVDELDEALNKRSGLMGLSGVSGDYREVEAAARDGHERAALALQVYADRVRAMIGGLAASMGGIDALIFTAGVGENSASLRESVCNGLEFLGVCIDPERNRNCRPDADLALAGSAVRILVIHTREDQHIARETRRLVARVV